MAKAKRTLAKESIETKIDKYGSLMAQKARIEKEMAELKGIILPEVDKAPERYILTDTLKAMAYDRTSERFDLKKAKAELDNRMLKPYIKTSTSEVLKVSALLKEEE